MRRDEERIAIRNSTVRAELRKFSRAAELANQALKNWTPPIPLPEYERRLAQLQSERKTRT